MEKRCIACIWTRQVSGRKGNDIREAWRIQRTCLLVGRKIVGKALVGSTVNPLDRGGTQYREMYYSSNVNERNENGRTKEWIVWGIHSCIRGA